MNSEGLSAKLWLLSKEIEEKVKQYKSSKQLTKTKRLYLKAKISNFKYTEGNVSYAMSHVPILKEDWDLKKFFDFTEKTLRQIPDYHRITKEISKRYEVNEDQANSWLGQFARILTQRAFEGLTDETLIDTISTFVNDLEKGSVDWQLKVWVEGLWPENEEEKIYEGLKIRRPKPSDLEVEIPLYTLPLPRAGDDFRGVPSAIIDLAYTAKPPVNYRDEIENIINCLRLFRLGSVFPVKIEPSPKSILANRVTFSSGRAFFSAYRYPISRNDTPKLREMLDKIKGLLPKQPLEARPEETDPINIALQRYNDAVLKPESIESRITSAITSFEALYLKAEERAELSHRLSQRAAGLLGLFDLVQLEVYNNLKRAYDIRSTFIHGSSFDPERRKDIAELAEKTLNYARVSLLIFLQLKRLTDKESLINKIDNSLLDTNARSKLEELVKENCSTFSEV